MTRKQYILMRKQNPHLRFRAWHELPRVDRWKVKRSDYFQLISMAAEAVINQPFYP